MKGPTNGWQLLCVVVLLTTAVTAVGAAQSTETTANATETPNSTSTTLAATTTPGAESPTSTGTPPTTTVASNGTTTLSQSPTQASGSDQATDDVPEGATPIEVGETVTGQLSVGDQDWTEFSLTSGGELTLSVTAQNRTNMSAFVYSGESLLESTYVNPGEQVTLTTSVDSGGQYYVFLRNEANNTAGAYAFEVSKSETATSRAIDDATEDTGSNSNNNWFGVRTLTPVGLVILLGYLLFRREGEREGEGGDERSNGEETSEEDGENEAGGEEEQED